MLQQQRQQQQVGGLGGSSKLSPSHHVGGGIGGPKLPGSDPLPHPGLAGSVADMHQKTLGPYSGESLFPDWLHEREKKTLVLITSKVFFKRNVKM